MIKNRIKAILKTTFYVLLVLTLLGFWAEKFILYFDEDLIVSDECSGANIALIKIHGFIVNYKLNPVDDPNMMYDSNSVASEEVAGLLEKIENNDDIKGIILDVDSPGGYPEAAEEIVNPLLRSTKPVAAFIREEAYSAGYFVATAADRIYASRLSDIGSIGVTMSYVDNSEKNATEGLTYNQLSVGQFKDITSPDKKLTAEEKDLLMAGLEKSYKIFVEMIAKNRGMDIKEVKKIADGRTFLGDDAKAKGLIDEIGDLNSAKEWLGQKLQIEPEICVLE